MPHRRSNPLALAVLVSEPTQTERPLPGAG